MQEIADSLRTALASPDPDRWTEGARAGLLDLASAWEREAKNLDRMTATGEDMAARDAYEECAEMLRNAIPVPSAPTQAPEANPCPVPDCHAGMLRDTHGGEVSCPACDVEATRWAFFRACAAVLTVDCDGYADCEECPVYQKHHPKPAPVEPEETR